MRCESQDTAAGACAEQGVRGSRSPALPRPRALHQHHQKRGKPMHLLTWPLQKNGRKKLQAAVICQSIVSSFLKTFIFAFLSKKSTRH